MSKYVYHKHNTAWKVLCTDGIWALVVFVSEISLVHCTLSIDFWLLRQLVRKTVRALFPWSNLYVEKRSFRCISMKGGGFRKCVSMKNLKIICNRTTIVRENGMTPLTPRSYGHATSYYRLNIQNIFQQKGDRRNLNFGCINFSNWYDFWVAFCKGIFCLAIILQTKTFYLHFTGSIGFAEFTTCLRNIPWTGRWLTVHNCFC